MRREHGKKNGVVDGIPVFSTINRNYSGKPKLMLINASSATDGLIYFLIEKQATVAATKTLVVCNRTSILLAQDITLRGTYGNRGAVCDGRIGISTNDSNYGYYVYTYVYDITHNTLTADRQMAIGRNWYWGCDYAYKRNDKYYYVATYNNSSRGPTTVNMTDGTYVVNELSPRNDMVFFYDEYSDTNNPFLAVSGARSSDGGSQNYYIKKLPATSGITSSSGAAVSNGYSNSVVQGLAPLHYYDSKSKIQLLNQEKAPIRFITVSDDYTTITLSEKTFPSGYMIGIQLLLTDGTGYYCDSSYNYIRYTVADYI